jgi:hypothetical protein
MRSPDASGSEELDTDAVCNDQRSADRRRADRASSRARRDIARCG